MYPAGLHVENLQRVQNRLRIVPSVGTSGDMTETPLRRHLAEIGTSAEDFAVAHDLSPWSVRHWARGDKMPLLGNQLELERATAGKVTPAMWTEWEIARRTAAAEPVALCDRCDAKSTREVEACTAVDCPARAAREVAEAA